MLFCKKCRRNLLVYEGFGKICLACCANNCVCDQCYLEDQTLIEKCSCGNRLHYGYSYPDCSCSFCSKNIDSCRLKI